MFVLLTADPFEILSSNVGFANEPAAVETGASLISLMRTVGLSALVLSLMIAFLRLAISGSPNKREKAKEAITSKLFLLVMLSGGMTVILSYLFDLLFKMN